jgi:hypothetical protein
LSAYLPNPRGISPIAQSFQTFTQFDIFVEPLARIVWRKKSEVFENLEKLWLKKRGWGVAGPIRGQGQKDSPHFIPR